VLLLFLAFIFHNRIVNAMGYRITSLGSGALTVTAMGLICAAFAGAVAYIIWDKQTGIYHLASMAILMLLMQLAYWVINFFMLGLIVGGKIKLKPKPHAVTE
jgi:hypothetical protein